MLSIRVWTFISTSYCSQRTRVDTEIRLEYKSLTGAIVVEHLDTAGAVMGIHRELGGGDRGEGLQNTWLFGVTTCDDHHHA